jgi:hypothetical protein
LVRRHALHLTCALRLLHAAADVAVMTEQQHMQARIVSCALAKLW